MDTFVADVNPKTIENARRQFVELYGSALVMNTYLKIALVLVSLVAVGLLALNFRTAAQAARVKPLVVRIDDVGRAEAVQYDATAYQPQAKELRYFLTQFVVKHFSRIRSTVQREYPDSLFFLEPAVAEATIAQNEQSRSIEQFLTNPGTGRSRCGRAERHAERVDEAAVQGCGGLPEGAVHTGSSVRTRARDVRRGNRFLDARPRPERVRAGQSSRLADQLLPRRSGVRGEVAMMANAAFLAALVVFLIVGWLAGELRFLAPFRSVLFHEHGMLLVDIVLLLFLNLSAAFYEIGRWFFLRDTGRKLRHLDHQLSTPDAVLEDLGRDLSS